MKRRPPGCLSLETVVAPAAKPSATTVYLTPPTCLALVALLDAARAQFVSHCALLGCQDFVNSPIDRPHPLAARLGIRLQRVESFVLRLPSSLTKQGRSAVRPQVTLPLRSSGLIHCPLRVFVVGTVLSAHACDRFWDVAFSCGHNLPQPLTSILVPLGRVLQPISEPGPQLT